MTSPTIITTGAAVAPGDVIFSADYRPLERHGSVPASPSAAAADDDVVAAEGCYVRVVATAHPGSAETPQRQVVAARLGTVQWEGATVRVFSRAQLARTNQRAALATLTSGTTTGGTSASAEGEPSAVSSAPSLGPRPGDLVHVRVVRVARHFVVGEIIAIRGIWCSTAGSTGLNIASSGSMSSTAFRGVLRVEDIRPFRPTKDQLQPPPPSASYQPGDVVLAEVISQSDARQYQLSTCANHCGVVESYLPGPDGAFSTRVKLQVVPGRREVMVNPLDGAVVSRWCPLLELTTSTNPTKHRRV